jgi:hypothetical protein
MRIFTNTNINIFGFHKVWEFLCHLSSYQLLKNFFFLGVSVWIFSDEKFRNKLSFPVHYYPILPLQIFIIFSLLSRPLFLFLSSLLLFIFVSFISFFFIFDDLTCPSMYSGCGKVQNSNHFALIICYQTSMYWGCVQNRWDGRSFRFKETVKR